MDRRPHYFALLILSLVILSSFYMSGSGDTAMGELIVEKVEINGTNQRSVHFLVYRQRDSTYIGQKPIILTIHGYAGTKDTMYSYNIELARRNFTVISVDLLGHGDSTTPFSISDIESMARDCYSALNYVKENLTDVSDEIYGVLGDGIGFQVGAVLSDYPIAPTAYAAIGSLHDTGLTSANSIPGNLLIALNNQQNIASTGLALDTLARLTGNESAEEGVTYGSFISNDAYRFDLATPEHILDTSNDDIVGFATNWFVEALQGSTQLGQTIPAEFQVYNYKTTGMIIGTIALLLSSIPLLFVLHDLIPYPLRPRRIEDKSESSSLIETFIVSSVLSVIILATIILIPLGTLQFLSSDLIYPNSLFVFGIETSLLVVIGLIVVTLYLVNRMVAVQTYFESVGISKSNWRFLVLDILRGIWIASIVVFWFFGWMAIAGLPEMTRPWISIHLLRFPLDSQILTILSLTAISMPLFILDALWIRGYIIADKSLNSITEKLRVLITTCIVKLAVTLVLAISILYISPFNGFFDGNLILVPILLCIFIVVSVLSTILVTWTSIEYQNVWPAIVFSAVLFAWLIVSNIPLI